MKRTVLIVSATGVLSFLAGSVLAWRLSESRVLRAVESTESLLAAARVERHLELMDRLDSGSQIEVKQALLREIRSSLAVVDDCRLRSECAVSMPELAPGLARALSRARDLK